MLEWSRMTCAVIRTGVQHIRTRRGLGHIQATLKSVRLQSTIKDNKSIDGIDKLLGQPSWSVRSLLPSEDDKKKASANITSKQLHHLLRLSALPPPKDEVEEQHMLETLASQLHFVTAIQDVDTTGVKPLQSLRDETESGRREAEVSLDSLYEALSQEEVVGKFNKRIRRRKSAEQIQQHDSWDVLGSAERKVGRYFVVEGGKD